MQIGPTTRGKSESVTFRIESKALKNLRLKGESPGIKLTIRNETPTKINECRLAASEEQGFVVERFCQREYANYSGKTIIIITFLRLSSIKNGSKI